MISRNKTNIIAIAVALMVLVGMSVPAFAGGVGVGYQDELLVVAEAGVLFVDVTYNDLVQANSLVFDPNLEDMDLGIGMQTEFWTPSLLSDLSLFSSYRTEIHNPFNLTSLEINEFDAGIGVRYEGYGLDLKLIGYGAYLTGADGAERGLTFKPRAELLFDIVEIWDNIFYSSSD